MNPAFLSYTVRILLVLIAVCVQAALPLYAVRNRLDAEINRTKQFFCFLNACMMTSFCFLYGKLLTAPLEVGNDTGAPLMTSSLICFGLCILQGALFFKTLFVKLPVLLTEETLDKTWRYLLFIPLALSILFLWVSPREAAVVMTGRVRITTLAFLVMVPPFFWMFYHGAWWITTRLNESARVQIENDMLQMEGKRYRELREYMEETRTLRHDFRQHINIISGLFHSGQTEKLSDYLTEYTQKVGDMLVSYCANQAVDAIAAHYDAIAAAQETRISWSLDLPQELPVLETDYCAVFGNLVENALRAVKNLPVEKREISVTSQMLSDLMLGLSVKNPYAGEIRFGKKGLPRSSREGHGVGLSSVKNTAKKYHGSLDVTAEDGIFSAVVLMNRMASQ